MSSQGFMNGDIMQVINGSIQNASPNLTGFCRVKDALNRHERGDNIQLRGPQVCLPNPKSRHTKYCCQKQSGVFLTHRASPLFVVT